MSFSLTTYSKDIVFILLGEKWIENHVYLRYLAVYSGIASIMMVVSEQSLIAIGMEFKANRLMWFRVIMLSLAVFAGYTFSGLVGMMQAMIIVSLFSMCVILIHISVLLRINKLIFIKKMLRLVFSASLMGGCIVWLSKSYMTNMLSFHYYVEQGIVVFLAGLVYIMSIFTFWFLAGKPEGFESTIFKKI